MRNAGLDEAQAGIKTAGRNINNLRYTDDTNLMAESEKEIKSLLMKVKEQSEKVGFKLNIQKIKVMVFGPIISCQIDGKTMKTVRDFIFLSSKITADGDCSHEIKTISPWKKSYDQPRQHIKKQRHCITQTSLVAQTVKCVPTMRKTWVQSLVREDLLEKEMATHSSVLAWKIPWTEEPGRLQSMGLQRVGYD